MPVGTEKPFACTEQRWELLRKLHSVVVDAEAGGEKSIARGVAALIIDERRKDR